MGFPDGFDINETGHMGMNLIRLLSKRVGGEHEWHSDPLGIRFEIRLPSILSPPAPLPEPGARASIWPLRLAPSLLSKRIFRPRA